jgi:predicted nucleotidyltransferase
LVGERQRVLGVLRAIEGELRSRGVVGLRLFGSLARGGISSTSDVDLLLSVAPGRRFSLLDVSAVRLLVVDRLGRDASVVVEADLTPAFRARIEADLVEIY